MAERIVVMNGTRIVQSNTNGTWSNVKVDNKVGEMKPGIYNLGLVTSAMKSQSYSGPFIHDDNDSLYQFVDNKVIAHNKGDFTVVPKVGEIKSVSYLDDQPVISKAVSLSRGRTR